MTDEDGMTPDERVWYRRQLERSRQYKAMIAARRAAGKSATPAACLAGSKRLLMPDDQAYVTAAYAELTRFALKLDGDLLDLYAERIARYEQEMNNYG